MSRGIDRAVRRAVNMKIELNRQGKLKSSPKELQECRDLLMGFVRGKDKDGRKLSADDRTRYMCARDIRDMTLKMLEYENPVADKPPPAAPQKIQIEILKPGQVRVKK
jgi:hypothetical protein